MPKEFTHFLIADKALNKVAAVNTEAAMCIKENYNLFMLGAILCDSPYYHLPFSGGKQELLELSKNIHNPCGEINRVFFKHLAEAVTGEGGEASFAFLNGILSHHLTDHNFHPFIFYFTGTYSNPSRHRFLESLIDMHLMDIVAGEKICPTSVDDYLRIEKADMLHSLKIFAGAASTSSMESEIARIAEHLYKALRLEILLSRLYKNRRLIKALLSVNNLIKGKLSPFITLFYPEEGECKLSILNSEFRYCDHLSGEEKDASLESITEKTAGQLSSAIIDAFENFKDSKPLFGEESMDKLFCKRDCKTFEFKHFDTEDVDTAMQAFLGIRK